MTKDEIRNLIDAAASKYGVPREYVEATIEKESNFDPAAVSPVGAMGLAQLMPATVDSLSKKFARPIDPYNPVDAVESAAYLWAENLGFMGGDPIKAAAAYHAGPGAVLNSTAADGLPDGGDGLTTTREYAHSIINMARGLSIGSPETFSTGMKIPDFSNIPDTAKIRLSEAIKEMSQVGASEEDIARFLTTNEQQIRDAANISAAGELPFLTRAPAMIGEFIGAQTEPSIANALALPASFATGPLAGKAFAAITPAAGIKRLAVRLMSSPKVLELANTAFNREVLGSMAVKSIVEEPTFLTRMAHAFGVGLPFSMAHAFEAANDDSDSTKTGAFVSTMGFFMGLDLMFAGAGGVGRSLSRVFGRRVSNLVEFDSAVLLKKAADAAKAAEDKTPALEHWIEGLARKPTPDEEARAKSDAVLAQGLKVMRDLGYRSPYKVDPENPGALTLTRAGKKLGKEDLEAVNTYMGWLSKQNAARESGFPVDIAGTTAEREAVAAELRIRGGRLLPPPPVATPAALPSPESATPGAQAPAFSGGRPIPPTPVQPARGMGPEFPNYGSRVQQTIEVNAEGKVTRTTTGVVPARVRRFLRRFLNRELTDKELLAIADGRAPEIVEAVETGRIQVAKGEYAPATKDILEKYLKEALKRKTRETGTQLAPESGTTVMGLPTVPGLGSNAVGLSGVGDREAVNLGVSGIIRATKQAAESLGPPEKKALARTIAVMDLEEVIDTKKSPVQRELRDAVLEGAGVQVPSTPDPTVSANPRTAGPQPSAETLAAVVTGEHPTSFATPSTAGSDAELLAEMEQRAAVAKTVRDENFKKEIARSKEALTSLEGSLADLKKKAATAGEATRAKTDLQIQSIQNTINEKQRIIAAHEAALSERKTMPIAVARTPELEAKLSPPTRARIERQAPIAHVGAIVIPRDAEKGVTYFIARQNIVRRGMGRGKPILEGRNVIAFVRENPESGERTIAFHSHTTADGSGAGEKAGVASYKLTGKFAGNDAALNIVPSDDPNAAAQLIRLYEGTNLRNYASEFGETIPKSITKLPFTDQGLHQATRFSGRRTEKALGLTQATPKTAEIPVADVETVAAVSRRKGGVYDLEDDTPPSVTGATAPSPEDILIAREEAAGKWKAPRTRVVDRGGQRVTINVGPTERRIAAVKRLREIGWTDEEIGAVGADNVLTFADTGVLPVKATAKAAQKAQPLAPGKRGFRDLEEEIAEEDSKTTAAQVMNAAALKGDAAVIIEANAPDPPQPRSPDAKTAMVRLQATYDALSAASKTGTEGTHLEGIGHLQTDFMNTLDDLKTHASKKGLVIEFIPGRSNEKGVVEQNIRVYDPNPGGYDKVFPANASEKAAEAIDDFTRGDPVKRRGGGRSGQTPKGSCG